MNFVAIYKVDAILIFLMIASWTESNSFVSDFLFASSSKAA